MSDAFTGVGAQLLFDDGGWQKLSEIKTMDGPSMSRDFYDVTNLDSTGGYREYIPGFIEPGEYSFTMHFNRSDYDALKTFFESTILRDFQLVLPDTDKTTFEFQGYVQNLPINVPEGPVTCDVVIKISGPVTVNSGT